MRAILGDINIQGHLEILLLILEGPTWGGVWKLMNLPLYTFGDLGLAPETVDAVIWELCQQQEIILITANRNADSPDSLEATICEQNRANSLPVFTLADSERILHSRAYAERVVERLLEYLIDIDNFRGTGRLYLP